MGQSKFCAQRFNKTQAELDKRDTELVYLSNCKNLLSCCPPLHTADSTAGSSCQPPTSDNQCTVSSSSYTTWESDSPACTFATNVRFTAHSNSDAQSRPDFSWGTNGFKNFNCYKESGRAIYTYNGPETSTTCSSVYYYCIPSKYACFDRLRQRRTRGRRGLVRHWQKPGEG
ncbi:uncharacterized protein THITE_110571 [Thermothielavioides terrestris NRRL 8126]|uniref:Uncharacterized protein n=1 Tax=Thermothielavioides terrestris (strain ATCC 38088 / NRRL 8126) TaxID=578455 RepID=G2R128_THETT|nr:uncharacterized protein THITE_110571 [Thermothielavioides terrestris NRRL 8126]AEO66525.1 hypothetical protein THITE_110571 [Thermothielavioides terrestris NRRL 8126]